MHPVSAGPRTYVPLKPRAGVSEPGNTSEGVRERGWTAPPAIWMQRDQQTHLYKGQ